MAALCVCIAESVRSRREFMFTPPTPTRQNSFVSSASAVCIGHNPMNMTNPASSSQITAMVTAVTIMMSTMKQ